MITRKQYMAKDATHREYYAQFVDESVRQWVLGRIGIERIVASTDPHLNDIHLSVWDTYFGIFQMTEPGWKCAEANSGGVSLSDAVCVAKEAARQLIERQENET